MSKDPKSNDRQEQAIDLEQSGEPGLRRWIGWALAAIALLAVAFYAVLPMVRKFRSQHVMRTAAVFVEAGNYRSAYLLLDQLVTDEPANFEARRRLARVLDAYGTGQALQQWETLVNSEPRNAGDLVGYATAALREHQLDQLSLALVKLRELAPASIDLMRLTAAQALAQGDWVSLRQAIERLSQAEPDNETTQFDLATLRLNDESPGDLAGTRTALEKFARGKNLRIRATLALLADGPRRWSVEENSPKLYLLLGRQLGLRSNGFGSSGQSLTGAFGLLAEPGLADLVEHMKSQLAPPAEDAARLALWLIRVGQPREALVWLETQDEKLRQAPAVLGGMATCALTLESWPKLQELLRQNAWGPVSPESVRFAFEARALRQSGEMSQAERPWENAIQNSASSQPGLRMLQRLAQAWHWPANKQMQVLWALVRQFPNDTLAWQKLSEQALSTRDSAQVWRVYQAWAQAAPRDAHVQVQRVVLGLLVRPDEAGLAREVQELFQQNPADPGARFARALAQWRGGQSGEALAMLDATKLDYANEPRMALVRGLVLASLGRRGESEKMFAAVPVERLLPEEGALLEAARKNLR